MEIIDFLRQISKLFHFNLLDLAVFYIHHSIRVWFLTWQPWMCALIQPYTIGERSDVFYDPDPFLNFEIQSMSNQNKKI